MIISPYKNLVSILSKKRGSYQKLCFYFFLINDFPLILFLAINILEAILDLFIIAF